MGFLDIKYDVFGLDINDLSLKIIKLEKKRKGFALVSHNEVRIAPGIIEGGVVKNELALIKIIKYAFSTIKGKKIKTKHVVASLPEEKSFSQVIQLPKMSEEELRTAVPLEAENYIPMSIEEVYLDFQVIPPIKKYFNNPEVLIVAMPKKIVDSYVLCLKRAGLVPVVLETESEAIARALIKKDNGSSPSILVDFGENNTNFVVFSGNSIRFTASIPISSKSLTEVISNALRINFHEAEKLKIEYGLTGKKTGWSSSSKAVQAEKVSRIMTPILEELIAQIKKYLNFYRDHSSYEYLLSEKSTEKIIFCGGGSELKGLAEFMTKNLGMPVEIGNPLENVLSKKVKNNTRKDLAIFTTAIGLALRQVNNNSDYNL